MILLDKYGTFQDLEKKIADCSQFNSVTNSTPWQMLHIFLPGAIISVRNRHLLFFFRQSTAGQSGSSQQKWDLLFS